MNPFDHADGMIVAPVSETKNINLTFGIFCDEHRFPARFIGLYDQKKIFSVGLISNVARRYPDGLLETLCASRLHPALIEAVRVLSVSLRAKMDAAPWYFYFVKRFEPTSLAKDTPYGVPRTRVFSVSEVSGISDPFEDASDLARALDGKSHPLGGKK